MQTDLEAAMTRFTRPIAIAPVFAAFAILAATVPASAPASARSNLDRYPVKIDNGSVGYAGDSSFTVSGKVGENGAVTVKVARGSQSANGQGRLSATDGSGMWIAGTGDCSGTWTAERRS